MVSDVSPAEVLRRIVEALEAAGVPYMLTGSFAGSLHGRPRATQDIDMVIEPTRASLERLFHEFPPTRYYSSREAAIEAFEKDSMFNIVDLDTGWKVDFIFRKPRPFSRSEFERRVQTDAMGIRLFVATPEDVLIAKLEWAKLGESERQIRDAAGIITTQGSDLDIEYIERWVNLLDLGGGSGKRRGRRAVTPCDEEAGEDSKAYHSTSIG